MAAQAQLAVSERSNLVMMTTTPVNQNEALFRTFERIVEMPLMKFWEALGLLGQPVNERTAQVVYLRENLSDWLYEANDEKSYRALEASFVDAVESLHSALFNLLEGLTYQQVDLLEQVTHKLNPLLDVTGIKQFQEEAVERRKKELLTIMETMSADDLKAFSSEINFYLDEQLAS
jgi:hypothetical protein